MAKKARKKRKKALRRVRRKTGNLRPAGRQKEPRLTQRQLQCLGLVAKGRTDHEIGRALRISEQTVHKHVEAAKKRYRVRTRIQLVMRALILRQLTLAQILKR